MKINVTVIVLAAIVLLLVATGVTFLIIRHKRRKKYPAQVREKWLDIQRLCASKETWSLAVINADKLLEDSLKQMHFKGKSIGERLVAAQRKLSDNDGIWYAHNLAKKLITDNNNRLKESDVKKALTGFRQALRDLGVLSGK